jgi:hypothetical protein
MDNDGYSVAQGDCNDANWYVNPGVAENCINNVDDDCDGLTDEDCVFCGNGVCDYNESYSTCALDCDPICGNGIREAGEQCDKDDFNGLTCQNYSLPFGELECTANCMIDSSECYGPVCGNDLCEQGETVHTCPQDCGGPVCGNTIIEAGEECDDGNFGGLTCQNPYGFDGGILACSDDCEVITTGCFNDPVDPCGNGVIDAGEACDGTLFGGQTCQSNGFDGGSLDCVDNCTYVSTAYCFNNPDPCGNGVIDAGEACDGGNFAGKTCQNPYGFDGGSLSCMDNCTYISTAYCFNFPEPCGDGAIEGNEVCDGDNFAGKTCQNPYGYDGGSLDCVNNCTSISTANCFNTPEPCGNGVIDAGEVCDGGNFIGKTCQNPYGYDGGSLDCVNNCTSISTANCFNTPEPCGNGVIDAGEVCDGGNFVGKTCQNPYGYDGGYLNCVNNCTSISTANCFNNPDPCGNGVIDAGEDCDGTNFAGKTCQNPYGFDDGYLACTSSCHISTANCYNDPVVDTSNWVAKPCENNWNCIELNSKYLDYMSVYVVGDCPPLGLYEYDGVWNPDGQIQVFDTDNDGFFELWLDDADDYWYDCEISWIIPDPNPNNNWSWAQYEGACLSNPDPETMCGPYLNCGYNQNSEYVCNVHFETPSGDPSGVIE